jgi:hypothetical protein
VPQRTIEVDGQTWVVTDSGRRTQYTKDEFTVCFTRAGSSPPETRVARYSPRGASSRENALAELTEAALRDLLARSQPSWTTPELGYRS